MYADERVIIEEHREELQDIKQVNNNCIWVEIYLRTGEWMRRCDAEYKQERMHGET